MNIANKITFSRIILIPVFVLFLLLNFEGSKYWAAGFFLFLAITDIIDGYVARKRKEVTDVGMFLDPLADKLLVSAALVFLVGAIIQPWMIFLIIGREFAVMGLRMSVIKKGINIKASIFAKFKTASQVVGIALVLFGFAYAWEFMIFVVIITLLSGLEYFWRFRKLFYK